MLRLGVRDYVRVSVRIRVRVKAIVYICLLNFLHLGIP